MNVVSIEYGAQQSVCLLCRTGVAILQLIKSRYLLKSKASGLAVSKAGTAAFESYGNDSAHSRCVTTGPIMLLIKYPTSQ